MGFQVGGKIRIMTALCVFFSVPSQKYRPLLWKWHCSETKHTQVKEFVIGGSSTGESQL